MPSKSLPTTLVLPEGKEFLISCPYYWGKGKTLLEAAKNLKQAGGNLNSSWRIHWVHPDTTTDGMGYMCHPTDHPPIVVAEWNPE